MPASWKRWFGGRVEARWSLALDETRHLRGGRRGPIVVRVQRGLLLVTREGDPQDHVLGPGDEVIFPPRGRLVAWALEPALASVQEARTRAGVAPGGRGVRDAAVGRPTWTSGSP